MRVYNLVLQRSEEARSGTGSVHKTDAQHTVNMRHLHIAISTWQPNRTFIGTETGGGHVPNNLVGGLHSECSPHMLPDCLMFLYINMDITLVANPHYCLYFEAAYALLGENLGTNIKYKRKCMISYLKYPNFPGGNTHGPVWWERGGGVPPAPTPSTGGKHATGQDRSSRPTRPMLNTIGAHAYIIMPRP